MIYFFCLIIGVMIGAIIMAFVKSIKVYDLECQLEEARTECSDLEYQLEELERITDIKL